MRTTEWLNRHVVRLLGVLVWALVSALPGVASAQTLTVEGSPGPVTLSPLLRGGVSIGLEGPAVRREVRLARVAWTVPVPSVRPDSVVPGITLHVTERPETGPCLRYVGPHDLPPSVNLPAARLSGGTALDLGGARFRPGRTYYVRGCVFGTPFRLGGAEADGPATNTVAVRIDWDGVHSMERVNLNVDSRTSTLERAAGTAGLVATVRATLNVRAFGRIADRLRKAVPDRFVVDVYVNGGLEPEHRAVVTGVARRLAGGAPDGIPVTVVHPVPPTTETHLVQYVINADGTLPEQNYEDNHASVSFGYHVSSTGVSFARNWHTEGPFHVGISLYTRGDDHVWVHVHYAGGPLEESELCPTASCSVRATTSPAVDPTPSLEVWLDAPDVRCVGPGGFFEPTLASSRTGGAAAPPPPMKSFFCYAGVFARVPFETTTMTAEGRVYGVSTRVSRPLRNVWSATISDPRLLLPDLVAESIGTEFLGRRPSGSASVYSCGTHPRSRFRVRNDGGVPSEPAAARVWISPPPSGPGARLCPSHSEQFHVIPRLAPGELYEFVRDFGTETAAAAGSTVNIDVDSGLVVVEDSKTNNRLSSSVPTCHSWEDCR
jgi:hypothetical protein